MATQNTNTAVVATVNAAMTYDAAIGTITVGYDAYVRGSNAQGFNFQVATNPNVIADKDSNRYTALLDFMLVVPNAPTPIKRILFDDLVIQRPASAEVKGSYGPKFTVGVPLLVANVLMDKIRRSGKKMSSSLVISNGYVWIDATIEKDAVSTTFYMITKEHDDATGADDEMLTPIVSPVKAFHNLKDRGGESKNAIGCAYINIKVKNNGSKNTGETSVNLTQAEWSLSCKIDKFFVRDFTEISNAHEDETPTLDPRAYATPALYDALMDADEQAD